MRIGPAIAAFMFFLATAAAARAGEPSQSEKPAAQRGPTLGEPDVEKWKFGIIVSAPGGHIGRLTGTTTVPMEWPEQGVKLLSQDLSPGVTVSYKSFGTAKQMVVNIPRVADGKEVHAILTMEITQRTLLPPEETDLYVVPSAKALPPDFKQQYLSPSPLIESNHARIKAVAKQLAEGQTKAWPHVRAIYDWVRKTIKYKEVEHKLGERLDTCVEAIDKGIGDCNQLTSTFIAVCRASGIPARTIRIPNHCYPEFYLLDDKAQGHWFPAQAAGTEAFGGIPTHAPILQKGDAYRITVPDLTASRPRMKTETVRLLPSNLVSMNLKPGDQPDIKVVCEAAEESGKKDKR